MPMNLMIRSKRKELGLTQEQVAEYIGVSTPAVNKWEKGTTYPDVSLLPALARLLKVDLNTLFGFDEGLSEQEIGRFCKEVMDRVNESGFESGFATSMEKVRQYPNCDGLIHTIALLLDGAALMSGLEPAERERYQDRIIALYERVAKSDDEKIRYSAIFMLASKYIGHGDYDRAQEMVDRLPEKNAMDKRMLQANLHFKRGEFTEAAKLLERKLLSAANEIQGILVQLADIALKEDGDQEAFDLAEISRKAAGLFDLWDCYSFVAPLQVALTHEDIPESISLLRSLLSTTQKPWKISQSPLYRHIAANLGQQNITGAKMLPALLAELENSSQYAFLRSNAEFGRLIEEYRAKC